MRSILQEKKNLIEAVNTNDSRFIVKVIESFQKKEIQFEEKKMKTKVILKGNMLYQENNLIDLDKIWAKPYLYTKMRIRLDEIINQILNANNEEITKNTSKFLKKVIYNNASKEFNKPDDMIDVVDFIKNLDTKETKNSDFIFVAEKIDEETLFKEEQINKAIEIMKIDDIKKRNAKIYDEVYSYLNDDFISNKYCDFKNNKCVAQRRHRLYPPNRKNGCCFMKIRQCPNLKDGDCTVECLACRLFACPYLTKMGIGYWASDFILLKAFFNKEQRKHLVFDFYEPKGKILDKMLQVKGLL